jgi:hypothetical protein
MVYLFLQSTGLDGVEKPEGSNSDNLCGVLGQLEGDLDVRLRRKVVHLCRPDRANDFDLNEIFICFELNSGYTVFNN